MTHPPPLALTRVSQTYEELTSHIQEINNYNIRLTYDLVGCLASLIKKGPSPLLKLNAIRTVHQILEVANYPALLLLQIYIVPQMKKAITYRSQHPQIRQQMAFFEKQGFSSTTPYIQSLSFNYIQLCSEALETGAKIKPLKVYQGKQYSDSSLFKKELEKAKKNMNLFQQNGSLDAEKLERLRERYLISLQKWEQFENGMVSVFSQILLNYLQEGTEGAQSLVSFIDILKYGQPSVTSEVLSILIEVFAFNQNFTIRLRALKMFDSFILWGDVEALLLANYSEGIEAVIRSIWRVEGQLGIKQGRNLCPNILGQDQEKQDFYEYFLRCLQLWSESFPTTEFFCQESSTSNSVSPLYKLYRVLKDKKRFIFVPNAGISEYERESHRNMHDKMIRNEMILSDINAQNNSQNESFYYVSKTFAQVNAAYELNKDSLLQLMTGTQDGLFERMKGLVEFRASFEDQVEKMKVGDETDEQVDQLIEKGLELVDLINAIQLPYIEYLKEELTFLEFRQAVTTLCIDYYNPRKQQALRPIMSEKLRIRKDEIGSIVRYQRSIPLWAEMREIMSSTDVKQLRSKFKYRHDKMQNSSRQSEGSSLNLQINTRAVLSQQSREDRLLKHHFTSKEISVELSKGTSDKNMSAKTPLKNDNCKSISISRLVSISKDSLTNSNKRQINCQSRERNAEQANSGDGKSLENSISESITQETNEKKGCETPKEVELAKSKAILRRLFNIDQEQPSENGSDKHPPSETVQVLLEENIQWMREVDSENLKFSFAFSHVVIFNAPYLRVERIVSQRATPNSRVEVMVQLILTPGQPLFRTEYELETPDWIFLDNVSARLPETLETGVRYCISLLGTLKSTPQFLPKIKITVSKIHLLSYTLPFSVNFFLRSCPYPSLVTQNYRVLLESNYRCFKSSTFRLSRALFPREEGKGVQALFPHAFCSEEGRTERYIWQTAYEGMQLMIVFEYQNPSKQMLVDLLVPQSYPRSFDSEVRLICSFLQHLLARQLC